MRHARKEPREPAPQPQSQPQPTPGLMEGVEDIVSGSPNEDGPGSTDGGGRTSSQPSNPAPTSPSSPPAPSPTSNTPGASPATSKTSNNVQTPNPINSETIRTQPTTTREQIRTTPPVPPVQTTPTLDPLPTTPETEPEPSAELIPTEILSPTDADVVPTTLVQETTAPAVGAGIDSEPTPTPVLGDTPGTSVVGPTSGPGSANNSGSGNGNNSSGGGDSSATKAGIALGVAAGVLLIIIAAWLLYFRRRKQKERMPLEEDDEKINGSFNARGLKRMSLAPRLSLRPVTQSFSPSPTQWNERRQSKNLSISIPPAAAGAVTTSRAPGGSAWDRPTTNTPTNNPDNPFGNHAERISTPIRDDDPAEPVSPISATSREPNDFPSNVSHVSDDGSPAIASAVPLARKTSTRRDGPGAIDLTRLPPPPLSVVPPSPVGTEYSMSSMSPGFTPAFSNGAAAIAAAGGPENSAVHRVQLEFVPSMEDEMALQVGQLVRLLHEYDDGWALCIRLDRTQQGVVPRTCLSVRPVKPRKPQGTARNGPPVKPNAGHAPHGPHHPQVLRPTTPQGRASSPTHSGATSSRSGSPDDRDLPPAGLAPAPRPQSPVVHGNSAPGVAY